MNTTAPWLRPISQELATPAAPPEPQKPQGGMGRLFRSFVDNSLAQLNPSAAAVWFVLFRHSTNGIACVAQSEIARIIGKSEDTVGRAIKELKEKGLVVPLRQGNNLTRLASAYALRGVIREDGEAGPDTRMDAVL
jgi:DNA-binding transcriptional ArsR family regulator